MRLVLLVLVASLAWGQHDPAPISKRARAEAQLRVGPMPPNFYIAKFLIVKDVGCAKDFARALDAGGIEMRKTFAALLEVGCAREVKGIFNAIGKVVRISSRPKVQPQEFMDASFFAEFQLTEDISGGSVVIAPQDFSMNGLIPIRYIPLSGLIASNAYKTKKIILEPLGCN